MSVNLNGAANDFAGQVVVARCGSEHGSSVDLRVSATLWLKWLAHRRDWMRLARVLKSLTPWTS